MGVNAQYMPLANSPSLVDTFDSKERYYPSKPPRRIVSGPQGLAGLMMKHFTRARCLLLIPLLALPVLYHMLLLRLANDLDDSEISNEWFRPGNVDRHNAAVIANITRCRERGVLMDTSLPGTNEVEDMGMEQGECGAAATTVVILASTWFREAYEGRNTLSEAMYAQSAISSLNALGYPYVITAAGNGDSDMGRTVDMWNRLRGNVRMIWADPEQIAACSDDVACVKTADNEDGIPAWRLLTFSYQTDATNPLGSAWTLSPHPSEGTTPLPYSIEPVCRRLTPLSPQEKMHPPQAYLSVQSSQDLIGPNFAWSVPYFKHLHQQLGIHVVTAFANDNETLEVEMDRAKVLNMGGRSNIESYRMIRDSFVLIGSGGVHTPVGPWEALCQAVPIINPILEWDDARPTYRTQWKTQHPELAHLMPPHVYHVRQHDLEGLKNALRAAVATPIGPYIPANMRFETVTERVAEIIEGDWKGRAEDLLASGSNAFVL